MTLIEFARRYQAVRKAQTAYFAARRDGLSGARELQKAREVEQALDEEAYLILSGYSTLDLLTPREDAS